MGALLRNLDRILGAFLQWMCILCFLGLMGILSGVVLIRFWPVAKLSWSDEVIQFLMAWLVFLGAAALWRAKAHFRIEALLHVFETWRFGPLIGLAIELVSVAFIILFTYYSYELTVAAHDVSPILSLPRHLWYAAMPFSGVIMVGYSLAHGVGMVRRAFRRPAVEPDPPK
ncbi:MAG: TRAP transporter small permease subunit [Rhodobacterales bacterium]|nr:TRAP transporter small permease subunit [Rhodobacterales bacterium]